MIFYTYAYKTTASRVLNKIIYLKKCVYAIFSLILQFKLQLMTQNNIDELIIEGIRDRKGRNITIVDMSDIEAAPVAKFIIAEGTSTMQVGAVADSVRDYLLEHAHIKPYNYDGYGVSEWIVVDYGDVMVHVFVPETRRRYNLEELWSDARITDIPNLD